MADITKRILEAVAAAGPEGTTEADLARIAEAADISQACERLMANGELVRRGGEAYTYHLPDGAVPRL